MVARKKDGKQKVVVAIDMGSTADHIAVNYLSENHVRPLFNSKAQYTQDRLQYERGAINACVNISDTGPAWIGDDLCASSVQLPVKFIISHGKGVMDDDNPLVAELRRHDKDQKFQNRCMKGMDMFMEALATEVQKLCGSKCRPLEIVEIGLSTPAHWSLDVEDRYRQIFHETFPRAARSKKDVKLCFISEIECIAHYTYDLIDLLVPEEGRWRFRLVCNEAAGQEGSLWLQREKLKPSSEEIVASHNVELKLEFYRSSNCFLVKPDEDLHFLHCGLGLEADGKFVALTEEFEESLKRRIDRRRKKNQSRGPNPGDANCRGKTPASPHKKRKRDRSTLRTCRRRCNGWEGQSRRDISAK
ncbi:hypothetical protein CMUS01_13129 [Colletotrichum musicola]|uniref:Uncharacterized protein n=1 Tax=Colletotrichum musicola TaxID=2175873 RepID=A0A8H6MX07_9PEZI|nr:hypothetical protein CMUS01_13129 [Colletotrichum musicola]